MKDNKITKNHLIIFLVGVLFISGAVSYAWFTAQTTSTGEGNVTTSTTVVNANTSMETTGTLEFNDSDIYPGHKNISTIKVVATGLDKVDYNVIWTGTNSFSTTLNYYVYKTTTEESPSIICNKTTGLVNNVTTYYEECTNNGFDNLGSIIAEGEIETLTESAKIELVSRENIQATEEGNTVYYHVVIEYPNKEEGQNADFNASINGEVSIEVAGPSASEMILLNKNIVEMPEITGISTEDTTGIVYSVEDDDGTSYVFRGAPTDNWVRFGKYHSNTPDIYAGYFNTASTVNYKVYNSMSECQNAPDYKTNCTLLTSRANKDMYWRIIRINGDGSIRLIYAGIDPNIKTGEDTLIGTSAYNLNYNDNAYVGFMYGDSGSSTYEATHANVNNSAIKVELDDWYASNGLSSYVQYIDQNAGFCNDRQPTIGSMTNYNSGLGHGINVTTYAPLSRLYQSDKWKSIQTPSLKCTNENNDLFTMTGANKGNRQLTSPIGLITSDEAIMAGAFGGIENKNYYLYNNKNYYTMSPYAFIDPAVMLTINPEGGIGSSGHLVNVYGVRPVINIRSDVTLIGSGLANDPYKIEGAV